MINRNYIFKGYVDGKEALMSIPEFVRFMNDKSKEKGFHSLAESIYDSLWYCDTEEYYDKKCDDLGKSYNFSVTDIELIYNTFALLELLDDVKLVCSILYEEITITKIKSMYVIDKELYFMHDLNSISDNDIDVIKTQLKYDELPYLIKYIRKIHDSKIMDSLSLLYPDFPYSCYDITKVIYDIIDANVKNHHCKIVNGHFKKGDYWMPHSWIQWGTSTVIDPTLIQFNDITKEGCTNFRQYFEYHGGISKAIATQLNGMIIYPENECIKKYHNPDLEDGYKVQANNIL